MRCRVTTRCSGRSWRKRWSFAADLGVSPTSEEMSFLRRVLGGPEPPSSPPLVIELMGEKHSGPCACCGNDSRSVWGAVHRGEVTEAVYYVHWTVGRVKQEGAHFDLAVGSWGEGAHPSDRVGVALEFRITEQGPSFMVIDASDRPVLSDSLVARGLTREQVIGTPLAQQAFDIVDAVWSHDARVNEIKEAAG